MDKEKLTAALDKKAMYGNDIDLNGMSFRRRRATVWNTSALKPARRKKKTAVPALYSLITTPLR